MTTTTTKTVGKTTPRKPAQKAAVKTAQKAAGARKDGTRGATAKRVARGASRTPAARVAKPVVPARTLAKLRARLEAERETYLRQAEDLAAEAEALIEDREPGDTQFDEESGEGDTVAVERERDLALSASARAAVEEIDRALARMEAGTYGICERCGKKISLARLEAVPQAALCIECKSRQERRR